MRLRNTAILALVLIALGAYLYFVESKQIADEAAKPTLLDFAADDVTGIALAYPDREIVLVRGDQGWRMTKPVDAAADEVTVKNLVRAIAEAEVKKTIDDPPQDLAQFGLANPLAVVTLTAKGTALPALKVGKSTEVSFSTYVQRADQPKIYLTGSGFRPGMEKQVKDLRDKKVIDFVENDVTRITLQGPQGETTLVKTDGDWTIAQPVAQRADAAAVRALLSAVRNLRATDFPNDAPEAADLAAYGLEPAQRTLTFAAGDAPPRQVLVGNETEQGIHVKTSDAPTVFLVGKWVSRDLDKGPNDLRDKTVLSFDPAAVTAVEVARGDGEQFTLASSAGRWSLAGIDTPVDADTVGPFVAALSRLAGNRILAAQADDPGTYGLARPALTITVRGTDNAPLGTIKLGSFAPNPPATEYAVMRADDPTVFELQEFQYDALDKHKTDFAAPPATSQP